MTDYIDELVARIDLQLNQAAAELEQLTLARQALINGTQPAPASAPRPRSRSRPKGRARSAEKPAVVDAGALLATLGTAGGLSSAELATTTGGALAQVREQLKALELDGHVRREGHARGLRWFAVTDEDRVARRAAEIEERLRQPKRERPHLARVRARRS